MITATATVTIIVEDVNDNGPEFDKSVYEANVMENTQVGLPISFHGAKTSVIVKDKDQVFNISNHCPAESIYMQPILYASANWFAGGKLFHIVRPCVHACVRPSVMFSFLKSHC